MPVSIWKASMNIPSKISNDANPPRLQFKSKILARSLTSLNDGWNSANQEHSRVSNVSFHIRRRYLQIASVILPKAKFLPVWGSVEMYCPCPQMTLLAGWDSATQAHSRVSNGNIDIGGAL